MKIIFVVFAFTFDFFLNRFSILSFFLLSFYYQIHLNLLLLIFFDLTLSSSVFFNQQIKTVIFDNRVSSRFRQLCSICIAFFFFFNCTTALFLWYYLILEYSICKLKFTFRFWVIFNLKRRILLMVWFSWAAWMLFCFIMLLFEIVATYWNISCTRLFNIILRWNVWLLSLNFIPFFLIRAIL